MRICHVGYHWIAPSLVKETMILLGIGALSILRIFLDPVRLCEPIAESFFLV